MKARRFAPLALILPLALVAACAPATTALSFSPNWYPAPNNPSHSNAVETLHYTVSTEETEPQEGVLYAKYSGSYTTTLQCQVYEGKDVYHYATVFEAGVEYGGTSSFTGTESIRTEVWFEREDGASPLRPIRSVRTVESVVPDLIDEHHPLTQYCYTLTVTYSGTTAHVKFDNLADTIAPAERPDPSEDCEADVGIGGDGSYLDNEQILFALRGLTVENGFTFRSLVPVRDKTWAVNTVATQQAAVAEEYDAEFTRNGKFVAEKILAHRIFVGYASGNTGSAREFVYADRVSGENTYRNVLLEIREPLLRGLGTLVYRLDSAEFLD